MPQDTIPDPDAIDPSDVTGPFTSERSKRRAALESQKVELERTIADQAASTMRKVIVAVVISVVGTGAGGLGTSIITSSQTEARMDERAVALERRVASLESQLQGIGALQRDVAALSARVDAWRQSDSASAAQDRAAIRERLERIEQQLDRRR